MSYGIISFTVHVNINQYKLINLNPEYCDTKFVICIDTESALISTGPKRLHGVEKDLSKVTLRPKMQDKFAVLH